MNLRATDHPEFDAWRWNDYWVPLDVVIEFKRDVYQMALTELARFLPRATHHNRYLRSGIRGRARDHHGDPLFDGRRRCRRLQPSRSTRTPALPHEADPPERRDASGHETMLSRWISSGSSV